MRGWPFVVALASAAVATAWAALMVATDAPCDGAPGCFDERGPMHPAFALRLTLGGLVATGLAFVLARRVRAGWFAGLQLLVAVVVSLPLLVQQLPDDVRVWAVPTLCEWVAAVALLVADTRTWRPSRAGSA